MLTSSVDDLKEPLPDVEPLFFGRADPHEAVVLSDIPGGGTLSPGERGGVRATLDESGRTCDGAANAAASADLGFVMHLLDVIPPPGLRSFLSRAALPVPTQLIPRPPPHSPVKAFAKSAKSIKSTSRSLSMSNRYQNLTVGSAAGPPPPVASITVHKIA